MTWDSNASGSIHVAESLSPSELTRPPGSDEQTMSGWPNSTAASSSPRFNAS